MEEKKEMENKIEVEGEEKEEGMKSEELSLSERQELEQLRKEKEKNFKERMYDKIHVSVKTLDRIIFALVVLFIIVVLCGIYAGR